MRSFLQPILATPESESVDDRSGTLPTEWTVANQVRGLMCWYTLHAYADIGRDLHACARRILRLHGPAMQAHQHDHAAQQQQQPN